MPQRDLATMRDAYGRVRTVRWDAARGMWRGTIVVEGRPMAIALPPEALDAGIEERTAA